MTGWLPSVNALRAFEAVARTLSYRLASEELHVTPAAVKQLVAKLEDAVELKLLERKGRGLCLTEAGLRSLNDLSSAFRQMHLAVARMREDARARRLVITVDPSFAAAWLVPRLESLRRQFPEMEVLIDSSMQIVDLNKGSADVGIRFGVKAHGDLVASRLYDERLSALCSPGLAGSEQRFTRLEDLAKAKLLRWDLTHCDWAVNTRRWNYWKHWLAAVGAGHVSPSDGPKFSDYNMAVQAAIAGQGFILGSLPILRHLIGSGLLVDPFGVSAKTDIGYDVVTTNDALKRKDVRNFIDWIMAQSVD